MDNLRALLELHSKRKTSYDGKECWRRLTGKLSQLKEQDLTLTYESAVMKLMPHSCDSYSVDSVVKNCIGALHITASTSCDPFALVPVECKSLCEAAIQDLRYLNSANLINKNLFVKHLLDTEFSFPLQVIWELHKAEVFQISTYVFKKMQPGSESLLSSAVLWLLINSRESTLYHQIITDIFASLLIASQSGHAPLSDISASSLKRCAEEIVNWVLNSPQPSSESIDFFYLSSPDLRLACGSDAMERFALTHLMHLLSEQAEPSTVQTLMNAVEIQEKTTLESLTHSFRSLLLATVKAVGGEKIVTQIGAAIVKPQVNWKVIFLLTAAVLFESSECCENFKRLTDELIRIGLEGGGQSTLSAGFLLARQCCSCDSKNFATYVNWFSSHFGPDSVTARNTNQFQSLMQLLTDIVPVESAENLRVHINKVPQAPTSCNSILHDYTVLARTRLADLNESSELAGLFSDCGQEAYPGLDSKQGEIVKVLMHFQQTREVMKPVLEASIFRRQYYLNHFLVELLGLPGSSTHNIKPEDFGLDSDIRHEFILALNSKGKVPKKLFNAYTDQRLSQEPVKSEINEDSSNAMDIDIEPETKVEPSNPTRKKRSLKMRPKRQ